MPADTIFALSSGSPPAGIAVVRISGPDADSALLALAGRLPEPRRATVAALCHPLNGELLDRALVLRFPGPASATGEDVAELHLHGGRSVVAAILGALAAVPGLRQAEPGEFTRRAFASGRIDLAEAEGLADLLAAETEAQRRAALRLAGGALSREVERWQAELLGLAAELEAALDFADEGDVGADLPPGWRDRLALLCRELQAALARPSAERLRDGIRVTLAGPPNAGKSSLFNALAEREAAIISPVPGTTRDLIEAPVAIAGMPFLLVDTAGLRESRDAVEAIGVERARSSLAAADIILWLGDPEAAPGRGRTIVIGAKSDLGPPPPGIDLAVSALTGEGLERLVACLEGRAKSLLPGEGEIAVNARHRAILRDVLESLGDAGSTTDLLIAAESLRLARLALDRLTGRAGVEDMLDALFGRFCIGK
jgi:tRNA modification GTPase